MSKANKFGNGNAPPKSSLSAARIDPAILIARCCLYRLQNERAPIPQSTNYAFAACLPHAGKPHAEGAFDMREKSRLGAHGDERNRSSGKEQSKT